MEKLLKEALELIQIANSIEPKYTNIIANIEAAITGKPTSLEDKIDLVLERLTKPKETKKSYAAVVGQ